MLSDTEIQFLQPLLDYWHILVLAAIAPSLIKRFAGNLAYNITRHRTRTPRHTRPEHETSAN